MKESRIATKQSCKHGRLYTLRSILETATNNGTEIEVKRKYLV
jgi:hypothetical protein